MDEFLVHIEKHRDEFYRFVLRTLWDSSMADDVFSAGVLAAYENRHKFTPGTNFRAWMYKILLNKCYVANREVIRAFEPLDESDASLATLDTAPGYREVLDDPDEFLDMCGDEVFHAFRRLSTAERTCLMMRVIERFSYQEIADTLDMPVGTVMTHLARGRAKLRKDLLSYAQDRGIVRSYPRLLEKDVPRAAEQG